MKRARAKGRDVIHSGADTFIESANLRKSGKSEEESELIRKLLEHDLEMESEEEGRAAPYSRLRRPSQRDRRIMDQEAGWNQLKRKKGITPLSHAYRNRGRMRLLIQRNGFFPFLFGDFARIRAFARRTNLIRVRLLPPKIQINPDVRNYFSEFLRKDVIVLMRVLEHALSEGWLYLSKLEYNILVEFYELCRKIRNTNFRKLDKREVRFRNFEGLEDLFLICYYKDGYRGIIKTALEEVLSNDNRFDENVEEVQELVDTVVGERTSTPCLYNFILGINIVRFRRHLSIRELMDPLAGEVITNYSFNCSDRIEKRINQCIDNTVKDLLRLQKEKREIERVKPFIDFDPEGKVDYETLYEFYDSGHERGGRDRAEKAKKNVVVFTRNFFKLFLRRFEQLLNGRIEIGSYGRVRVFASSFFKFELERIRFSLSALEDASHGLPTLSRDRYLDLRRSNIRGIPAENEALRIVGAHFSFLLNIAKKLVQVKLGGKQWQGGGESTPPLDPTTVYKGDFAVPYGSEAITIPRSFDGRSVLEAIDLIVHLCYQTGMLYMETGVYDLLLREGPVDLETAKLKELINRIADSLRRQKIKETYGF
jgi:hypothetical protein